MKEIPHRVIDDCLEWEDRALIVADEEELVIESMKLFLAALGEDDGADF